MSSRATIFSRIRTALGEVAEKAAYPDYDSAVLHSKPKLEGTPREAFERNFVAVGGKLAADPAALAAYLLQHGHTHGYCDPALMENVGQALAAAGIGVEATYDRSRYEDYRFGITRATAAIAESGSLVLDDALTSDRLAALSPWVHIAVVRESDLRRSIPEAIAALGTSRNVIFVTGPSKTADVEGILIEGVHGPGEQFAMFV